MAGRERGLIRRSPDPADGRGSLVSLTPSGVRLQERIFNAFLAASDDLLVGLELTERRVRGSRRNRDQQRPGAHRNAALERDPRERGVRHLGPPGEATAIAPFDYVRLLYAIGFDIFLFATFPDAWTLVGSVVIIGSTLYIARRQARLRSGESGGRDGPAGPAS